MILISLLTLFCILIYWIWFSYPMTKKVHLIVWCVLTMITVAAFNYPSVQLFFVALSLGDCLMDLRYHWLCVREALTYKMTNAPEPYYAKLKRAHANPFRLCSWCLSNSYNLTEDDIKILNNSKRL